MIEKLKKEFDNIKEVIEKQRIIWRKCRQDLKELKEQRPQILAEIVMGEEGKNPRTKIKELEETFDDAVMIVEYLEKKQDQIKKQIEDLKYEQVAREENIELYNELKADYQREYKEQRELEKRGFAVNLLITKAYYIKLRDKARWLNMQKDLEDFIKTFEKEYGKLKSL